MSDAPRSLTAWVRHAAAVLALALLTSAAWMFVVPPFEGPDELFFYSEAHRFADHPERSENLFYRLAVLVLRSRSRPPDPVQPRSNPAFQFVGNRHGEVNRWNHDRPQLERRHSAELIALRALVVLIAATALLMIDEMAWLCLPDRRLRWIVVAFALWIPQAAFMNVVVQRDVVAQWLGAAIGLVIVAAATGRLRRIVTWTLLLVLMALMPLADRQAYFLVGLAAIALVMLEQTWLRRAAAAFAIVLPVGGAAWLVSHGVESGTDLSRWIALVAHPLRPFTQGDPTSLPPDLAYYTFEFFPKMFTGFWGWMGQPSVLMPAFVYAALVVLTALAAVGLVVRLIGAGSSDVENDDAQRLRARRLLFVGVVLMCVPIVYGPALAGRNLWYGRWLFPMLGPIMIGFALGLAELLRLVRRYPHRSALVLTVVSAGGALLWLSGTGDALRRAVMANHYGDRARLVDSIQDTLITLSVLAGGIELWALTRRWRLPLPPIPASVAGLGALNAMLLVLFIKPLYAPLTPDDYVELVTRSSSTRAFDRAADIYAAAIKSYPDSSTLAALGDQSPRLLFGGKLDETIALLERRLERGVVKLDRDALFMLAARLQQFKWSGSAALDAELAEAETEPDRAEPAALVRLELDHPIGRWTEPVAPLEAGRGRRLNVPVRSEFVLEGYTSHPLPEGTQIVIYARSSTNSDNRRVWVHAYPVGSTEYQTIETSIGTERWQPGQLVWQVFELPRGRFAVYVGQWVGNDIGPGAALGVIP